MSLDNRDIRKTFRVNEYEDIELKKGAQACNLKESEYIRFMLFENSNVVQVPSKFSNNVYDSLNALKEKYLVLKYNTKDTMIAHKILLEIKCLERIIKNLKNIEMGKEVEL